MKTTQITLCVLLFFSTCAFCSASNESQTHFFTIFSLNSSLGIRVLSEHSSIAMAADKNITFAKSPNEAFLYSLAIPGMGQIYTGMKHGYIYTAAEVALLTTYFILRNDAVNIRDDYRQKVRDHVHFIGPASFENWDPVEDFEHATQYDTWYNQYSDENSEAGRKTLERTGKWYWEDIDTEFKNTKHSDIPVGSGSRKYRLEAFDLRQKANSTFQTARTILGLVIINHIVSAVEARITTKRINNKLNKSQAIQIDVQTEASNGTLTGALVFKKKF